MSIGSGTYTIKADGTGDYVTVDLALAAIASGGQTGDLKFWVDGTVTCSCGPAGADAYLLNGHTRTFEGVVPNRGSLNSGSKIVVTGTSYLGLTANTANSRAIFKNLIFESTNSSVQLVVCEPYGTTGPAYIEVYGCVMIRVSWAIVTTSPHPTGLYTIKACKLFEAGLALNSINTSIHAEHVSIDGNDHAGAPYSFDLRANPSAGASITLRNCLAINADTAAYYFTGGPLHNCYSCRDDDGSIAGLNWADESDNEGNITPANEFFSLDTDSGYYLMPTKKSEINTEGATPVYTDADIAELAIPYYGDTPIGCHVSALVYAIPKVCHLLRLSEEKLLMLGKHDSDYYGQRLLMSDFACRKHAGSRIYDDILFDNT